MGQEQEQEKEKMGKMEKTEKMGEIGKIEKMGKIGKIEEIREISSHRPKLLHPPRTPHDFRNMGIPAGLKK